jgi:hypothetical protein
MIHEFYKRNNLRVHEISVGKKHPTSVGWPLSNKKYEDVESLLCLPTYNKYGWLLDDNHLVIDIDLHNEKENGLDSLAKFEADNGVNLDEVCGAIVYTPSGGRHYYFKKPVDVLLKRSSKEKYPGIDFISCQGKQVVAANSKHDKYPGEYRLSDGATLVGIPQKILNALIDLSDVQSRVIPDHNATELERSGDDFNTSSRGLQVLIGSLSRCGYTCKLNASGEFYEFNRPGKSSDSSCSGHIGKQSKRGNYQLTCFSLADPIFPSGESISIFHAYALLVHRGDHHAAAIELYDIGFASTSDTGVDISRLLVSTFVPDDSIIDEEPFIPVDPGSFPQDCMLPPGFIESVVKFTLKTSDEPQPILALAGAMCLMSVLTGRKIRNERDNRTNIFVLGLGPSGCGKDRPRRVNTDILTKINAIELIGADSLGSGNGLESQLKTHPAKLFQLDEIGDLLKAIKKEKGSGYLAGIVSKVKALMTSSNGTYSNSAVADFSKYSVIKNPHLVIFGTATPEAFWNNLMIESVEDGFLGRIFPMEVDGYVNTQEITDILEIPDSITEEARAWVDFCPSGSGNLDCSPHTIRMSAEARKRHLDHCNDIDGKIPKDGTHKPTDALWKRAKGRSATLALLFCASRCGPSLDAAIELCDVELAIKITNWITRRTLFKLNTNCSENETHRAKLRVFEIIRRGPVTKSALIRKTQWLKPRERNEIISEMLEDGRIISSVLESSTKKGVVFSCKNK